MEFFYPPGESSPGEAAAQNRSEREPTLVHASDVARAGRSEQVEQVERVERIERAKRPSPHG
jgi:hypothetical protein